MVGGGMPTNNNGYADVISPHTPMGNVSNTGHSQRLVEGCAASLSHPYRKTFRRCPVFRATLHCKDFFDGHATLRLIATHGARQSAHGSCFAIARIDSPFRGWAVPSFLFRCHIFQGGGMSICCHSFSPARILSSCLLRYDQLWK